VVGHWRRNATARAITIDLQLYRCLNPSDPAAVGAAVQRFRAFAGLHASIGPVDRPEGQT
jgi:hypothetical protein